jgi:hypothetical protein
MKLSHLLIATLLSSGIAAAQTTSQIKKQKVKPKTEKKQKQKVLCSEKVVIDPAAFQKPFSCPACGRG